jgi:hypothetical protein
VIRATPLLAQAHALLWEVREACHDGYMAEMLTDAMERIQDAQTRLRGIEEEARGVDA